MALLEIDDLSVRFSPSAGGAGCRQTAAALDRLSLVLDEGEILAVIGASGSGKSVLAHALLGILPANAAVSGSMRFDGAPLTPVAQAKLRGRQIALVPQSVLYLNPLMRAGTQVKYAVKSGDPAAAQAEAFARYRLAEEVARYYPHQLSGGMARAVLLSTATVGGARLLIADEPTPGLEPAVVAEAMIALRELARQGRAVLLITHDIEAALAVADRVAVLYAGTVAEIARADDFAGDGCRLRHPYTRALWRALPHNGFVPLPGAQPANDNISQGCAFAPRCSEASGRCQEAQEMKSVRDGWVRCVHAT